MIGVRHTCTAKRSSSHWGQGGACPQSAAHPPPLSGHLSAVEPTAEAALLLLGYGSLWTEKHVTHLPAQKKTGISGAKWKSTLNNTHAVTDTGGRIQAGHWINLVGRLMKHKRHERTLRVPGQVVCDGIEEELSCLLPLIVKLLLVTGVTHTMQCY